MRRRESRGSVLVQTGHVQPVSGTPVETFYFILIFVCIFASNDFHNIPLIINNFHK